jgi:diguanylate cyclase (GGDEF)-like protein
MDSGFDHGSTARSIRPIALDRPAGNVVDGPGEAAVVAATAARVVVMTAAVAAPVPATQAPDAAVARSDAAPAIPAFPAAPHEPSAAISPRPATGARDDTQPIIRASTAERIEIVARRTRMVPIATFEVPNILRPIAPPDGWTDLLTGADGPRFWDRIVLSEQARVSRYHRPVTVAFAEIVGLDRLAGQWGWDVAERALAACARRLGREIRSSDHIARLEQARFGILLTETTEIAAINFVERARASCERELGATGSAVSIGFGWASPPDKGDLSDAIDLALTRLTADLAADPEA